MNEAASDRGRGGAGAPTGGPAMHAAPWRVGLLLSRQARDALRAGAAPREIFFQPVEALSSERSPLLAVSIGVWLMRPDLQAAFDLERFEGQARFLAWQVDHGVKEYAILREAFARPDVRGLYLKTPGAPPAPAPPLPRSGGVNLVGHLHARLGVGEDARCAAAALTAAAIPHVLIDAPVGADIGREPHAFAAEIVAAPVHAANLLFMSAWETFRYFCVHGSALWRGRKTICVWPWELPQWPEPLDFCMLLADEIWAISAFVRNAFELRAPVPVVVMPSAATAAATADRAAYGLPDEAFIFVCFFDGNSSYARKNPAAAIAAFQTAFPSLDFSVRLVVKAMRAGGEAWRDLQASAGGDPRIAFVDEEWSREETLGLIASCDCLVSLHRAEGFGRPIAEAILLGRAVVATRWSGNLDFRDAGRQHLVEAALRAPDPGAYAWSEGQVWAEPDPLAAAQAFLDAFRARDQAVPAAGAAFDPALVGARYRTRLEALGVLGA